MELLQANFWWILLLITVIFIFLFKNIFKRPDAFTSKFEAQKKLENTSSSILNIISEALKNAGFKKVGFDEEENRFYAQSKVSMSSWSEYIEVKINTSQNETELNFKSMCALPTQIYDWGKNKRNWKKFDKELKKLMPT